jgi:hypothetical protein
MQAVRFIGFGRHAQIEDVPKPAAGPRQVLIKIGGAGVSVIASCDDCLISRPERLRRESDSPSHRSCRTR